MHAVELLKAIRDHYAGKPLGQFASELLSDIEADRNVLARLTENTGGASGGPKEWASWLAEKVSRLKLKHDSGDGLGTFEALEFLVLGIHGKRALWRALAAVAPCNSGLLGTDFGSLIARAENQHARLEEERLNYARNILGSLADTLDETVKP
jgi:hypothetical protein